MQNVQYPMQNTQYPMQNMQYQTKLSPSYPQSYPQKGAIHCKTCSTTCKIRSIKQSYPQVIHRVIPKKVLQHAKYAVPPAKYIVPPCKIRSTTCKIRSTPCKIRSTTCKICSTHCKICSTNCKIRSTNCKICSIKQSYPQVIPRVIPNGSVEEKWT